MPTTCSPCSAIGRRSRSPGTPIRPSTIISAPTRDSPVRRHTTTTCSPPRAARWWSGPLDHRGIACADSWDGTPNGTHVLEVDGAAYTTRYVAAAEPGARMRISLDAQAHADDPEVVRSVPEEPLLRGPITVDQAAGTRVVVNVFDGGPRTKVAFALDDGPAIAMTRVARPDPVRRAALCAPSADHQAMGRTAALLAPFRGAAAAWPDGRHLRAAGQRQRRVRPAARGCDGARAGLRHLTPRRRIVAILQQWWLRTVETTTGAAGPCGARAARRRHARAGGRGPREFERAWRHRRPMP